MNVTINLAEWHLRDDAKPSVIKADLIKVVRVAKDQQAKIKRLKEGIVEAKKMCDGNNTDQNQIWHKLNKLTKER